MSEPAPDPLNAEQAAAYLRERGLHTTTRQLRDFAEFNGPVKISTPDGPRYPLESLDAYFVRTKEALAHFHKIRRRFELARIMAAIR